MLGRSLLRHLNETNPGYYECTGTGLTRVAQTPAMKKLDLLNPDAISQIFREIKPNVVVHCAAERFPDRASADPDRTFALNVDSTLHLAKECANVGARMIYISTDYVFDGGVNSAVEPPYMSNSKTMPINIYGESKLAGEEAVSSIPDARAVIVRVPVLYATDCYDLSESAALVVATALLSNSPATKIDHWGVRFPTLVDDVSSVLRLIIDATQRPNHPLERVRLHISSPEQCTKYELVKLMAEITGSDVSHIEPDPDAPAGAPRPRNTQLNCDETWKALEIIPHKFIPLREGMRRALAPFMDQFINQA